MSETKTRKPLKVREIELIDVPPTGPCHAARMRAIRRIESWPLDDRAAVAPQAQAAEKAQAA